MSQAVIKRLRAAIAGSRGVSIELPKAFIIEVLEAMEAAAVQVPVVDLDALVRKQREWNEQVIVQYLRLQEYQQQNCDSPTRWRSSHTACSACDAKMIVLGIRKNGRKLRCPGCERSVTIRTAQQPEKA